MYINPFWLGFLSGSIFTIVLLIILAKRNKV
jgi:hypothetical protein